MPNFSVSQVLQGMAVHMFNFVGAVCILSLGEVNGHVGAIPYMENLQLSRMYIPILQHLYAMQRMSSLSNLNPGRLFM